MAKYQYLKSTETLDEVGDKIVEFRPGQIVDTSDYPDAGDYFTDRPFFVPIEEPKKPAKKPTHRKPAPKKPAPKK